MTPVAVRLTPRKVTTYQQGEVIYFDLLEVKICYIEFLLLQDQLSVGYDYFSLHFRIVNFDLLNTKKSKTRARCKITVQANYEITNLLLSKKSWKVRFYTR